MPKSMYREKMGDEGKVIRKYVKGDHIIFVDPRGDEYIVSFGLGQGIQVRLNRKTNIGPMRIEPRYSNEIRIE
jgi:hypothetical protein